jgi:hypothetical protein
MINLLEERVVTLVEAARLVPPGRGGRPTHLSTLLRWITRGVRGVRLEAVRLGGRWVTSKEALQRFADRLTTAEQAPTSAVSTRRTRAVDAVEQELSRLGL